MGVNNNKFESNRKYFTISIYVLAVLTIGSIIIKLIFSWDTTAQMISGCFKALSPFLIGFFIAYMLNPIVNTINRKLCKKLFHIKNDKVCKGISIFAAYVFALGLIALTFVFLIPQIITSIVDLCSRVGEWIDELSHFLNNLEKYFPQLDVGILNDNLEKYLPQILDPKALTSWATSIVPEVVSTSMSVVKWVSTSIIALIVSCYMLGDKQTLTRSIKRLIYAVMSRKRADYVCSTANECHRIFSSFISGKTLDSIIIGILCFIFMGLLHLPYALLISVIVGITNMIPYFGPFIGAVPGAFIILLISPIKMLIYLALILVLQQFDGLYLGPKILGNSTGLRPIWIIFAITFGGAIGGFIGMFLGVPTVAVIAFLMERWINRRLNEKQSKLEEIPPQPDAELGRTSEEN